MKPFKETKLGIFLKDKAPHILDKVGDLLPDSGVLGLVKNLINTDEKIDPAVKLEFAKMEHEFQIELLKDVQSARTRETEFVKATGHIDWMQSIVGGLIMIAFIGCLFLIGFKKIPDGAEHLMVNALGIIEGLVVGYYYGSSAGSRLKDMKPK